MKVNNPIPLEKQMLVKCKKLYSKVKRIKWMDSLTSDNYIEFLEEKEYEVVLTGNDDMDRINCKSTGGNYKALMFFNSKQPLEIEYYESKFIASNNL